MEVKDLRDTKYAAAWKESREEFLHGLALSASEIEKLYERFLTEIADDIRKLGIEGELTATKKKKLNKAIQSSLDGLGKELFTIVKAGIASSFIGAGKVIKAHYHDHNGNTSGFDKSMNEAFAEYLERKKFGFTFSERVWIDVHHTSKLIHRAVDAGLKEGMDSVKIAKALEGYVKEGSATLVAQYPNMYRRMGHRVPKHANYEALRLCRTEYSFAFNEGTKEATRLNPYCVGVGFRLANTHPAPDVCDTLAHDGSHGIGPGNYPTGSEPMAPAHPNCLCTLIPLVRVEA